MSTRRPWRSVRFRITCVATITVVIVLAIGGFVLLSVQKRQVLDNLDATLSQRADDLESVAQNLDLSTTPVVLTNLAGDDVVVQVVDGGGDIIAASANAIDVPAIGPADPDQQLVRTVRTLPIEDDEYRILSRPISLDGRPVVLHVATNTDDLRDVTARLRRRAAARRTTRRGRSLGSRVGPRRTDAATGRAHPVGGRGDRRRRHHPPDLAARDRGRDRAAGADDERTARTSRRRIAPSTRVRGRRLARAAQPLARMRTELDVRRTDGSDSAEVVAGLSDEVDHLTALVDDLLHLARADAADAAAVRRPVDLDDIVLDEARRIGGSSEIEIDLSAMSAAHLDGDPNQLRRMVRNILANAERHAAKRVSVTLRESIGRGITLTVTDDGPGIDPGDRERVFERFVRLDAARTRHDGGTGLGLAIARDIAERHGGAITLDDVSDGSGARFVVTLPN